MKLNKWAIASLLFGSLLGYAVAQTVVLQNITGNEAVLMQLGGPGGTGAYTTTNVLRNGNSYVLQGGGTTVGTSLPNNVGKVIATSAITTWNIGLPVTPFDGQAVAVACPGGGATTVSLFTGTITLAGSAFTTCVGGGSSVFGGAEYTYSTSANTWFRVQ